MCGVVWCEVWCVVCGVWCVVWCGVVVEGGVWCGVVWSGVVCTHAHRLPDTCGDMCTHAHAHRLPNEMVTDDVS